jgi:predicted MPP superfamily phosphohydrolase
VPEKKVLNDVPADGFILLLKHRPVVDPGSLDHFDLQLSGHLHKGQIFPFNLLVDMFHQWRTGTHQVSNRSRIHISRGSGTWGPPFRLLAPPEITIIDLMPDHSP